MNAIVQSMQGLSSARLITLSIVGISLLLVFTFLSIRITTPVLSPLYTNLSADDSAVIVTELGAMGVEFDVSNSGSEILVQSSDVLRVRMTLAQKGLPSKGSIVGYEIFDQEKTMGTSNFVLNVNLLRALEGELGRTISALESIKSARVHLVMPKRDLFRKERIQPTASVILTLNNRTDVPKEETGSIKPLVGSAVPGLKTSHITIVDNTGRLLARGGIEDDEDTESVSASNAEEFRANFENRIAKKIEHLLEQAVGIGNIQAKVSAELAFDRITVSAEEFDPDGQVPRSIQSNSEITTSADGGGGTVSVSNNLPNASEGVSSSSTSSESEILEEITNFEISKKVTSKISEVGTIQKLSVAVLVDGTYRTEINEEDDSEERIYVPRSDEELDQLNTLVQTAIGYNAERGDTVQVINMQFNDRMDNLMIEEGAFDWLKRDLDSILKTIMVGIVAILAIMLVIRPLVNRAFDISQADIEAEATAQQAAMVEMQPMAPIENEDINLDIIQTKVDSTPTKKVNDLMDNNPEETLSVIRNWLTE